MRLDHYLVENNFARSRSHAQDIIKRGIVHVNAMLVQKPKFEVQDSDQVTLSQSDDFVSRSANKIASFIQELNLNFQNQTALDVGASTGGFTQVLLTHGASQVYCVDVGHNQLVPQISQDPKVTNFEGVDPKLPLPFQKLFDLVVIDVSFTSSKPILLNITQYLHPNGKIILLFKPQFEGQKQNLTRQLLVRESDLGDLQANFELWLQNNDFQILATSKSELKGKKGNQEFLYYLEFNQ